MSKRYRTEHMTDLEDRGYGDYAWRRWVNDTSDPYGGYWVDTPYRHEPTSLEDARDYTSYLEANRETERNAHHRAAAEMGEEY